MARPLSLSNLVLMIFAIISVSGCVAGGGHHHGGGGPLNPLFQVTITDSGGGTFTQGQQGATYTVTIGNQGQAALTGNVMVTIAIPPGETAVSITGNGWTCVIGGACSRQDGLLAGQNWPAITVTVNVAANAASPQVFSVLATGGGSTSIGGQDSTTITSATALSIAKSHLGDFVQGQVAANYTVTVTNIGGRATSGAITVTEIPPPGLTVTAMAGGAGSAWVCTVATLTCTRSDALAAGASYDNITVTVNVSASAPASVTNQVSVSGGGSASANASDPTTITPSGSGASCPLPALGNEAKFTGIYAGILNGWVDPKNGIQGPLEAAAAWHANGSGSILAGEVDAGSVVVGAGAPQQSAPKMKTFTGCYNLGPDLRGLMVWTFAGGRTAIFAIAVRADGSSGRIIELDDLNPNTGPGTRDAGYFQLEAPVTATNAPVAFSLSGWSPNGSNSDYRRSAAIGVIGNITFDGVAANGTADIAITNDGTGAQANIDNQALTATFTAYDALGRGTATISFANLAGLCGTPPCPLTLNFAYYLGDPGRFFLQSTDTPDNRGHALNNGEAIPQSSPTFSNASLSRAVFQMTGVDLSSNHTFSETAAGLMTNNSGAITVFLDLIRSGSLVVMGTQPTPNGSLNISANGMGSITIGSSTGFSSAPAPFSVAMYGPNAGFIMEGTQASVPSPSTILLGDFGPQTVPAGGFVDETFSGLYILGTDHPANTSSGDVVGLVSTPSPQTSPASFGGTEDSSSGGAACSTSCVLTEQAVSGTYTLDANGRFPITVPSFVTTIGWLRDNDAGQADKDAVILTNIIVAGAQSPYNTVLKVVQ